MAKQATDAEVMEAHMESIPQTPERKYGGTIAALLFAGLLGTSLFLDSEQPEPNSADAPAWTELDDGTGVEYVETPAIVLYKKVFSDSHRVFAHLSENGFHSFAWWKTDCVEGTEIETSRTFSSGKPMFLRCKADGWLQMRVKWSDGEPVLWSEDFDGFKVDVDFTEWNFTKARQFMTLQKAKQPEAQEG